MAGRDLNDLARRLNKIAASVPTATVEKMKEVAVNVAFEIAQRTPVDEAVARSNWIVKVGSPISKIGAAYRPYLPRRKGGQGGWVTERRNLFAVRDEAKAAVALLRAEQPIYITNNVPYIQRLNRGYSLQAPAGFVQMGIMAGLAKSRFKRKFLIDVK